MVTNSEVLFGYQQYEVGCDITECDEDTDVILSKALMILTILNKQLTLLHFCFSTVCAVIQIHY
jgi:hypothetical protein